MSQANLAVDPHAASMGEGSPFAIPSSKLVVWLFIISDAVTFGAFLFAYGYIRNASTDWPTPFEHGSIWNALLMTFILVTSSLTILLAVRAAQNDDRSAAFKWTLITAAGGVLFAILHLREWSSLIGEGVRMFQNPWGAPMFGATFFSITGLHMLHVIGGVIALTVVALIYKAGRYSAKHIEIWSLYWHFVDIVWMFVVPMVYLLNMKR
ncbi:MAG TPA: cytochrome c oxidase subunit 3 [Terriglobales bacterium]|nr:cytochrome c oxidase subunit 3 [Terriglobales bacterium]